MNIDSRLSINNMNAGYATSYYLVRGLVGNLTSQILNTPLKL